MRHEHRNMIEDNEVMIGMLSLMGTMVGTFSGILTANKLTNYRIAQLEEKQNKFNNVIARTYRLEEGQAVLDQRVTRVEKDIEDLKEN